MGKVGSGWIGGNDEDPDEEKRKLRLNLDQIRKNALGRKRDLRNKESIIQKPKTSLMKALNEFASQRRKIEEATQIKKLIHNKPKIIKQEVIQPRNLRGFFGAGIKGRELVRPDRDYQKYKKAVEQSDPLQLMNSGILCRRPEEIAPLNNSTKSPIESDHGDLKMEIGKILNSSNFSDDSTLDLDNPGSIEFPFSPVIGRHKGAKKKVNKERAAPIEVHRNFQPREKEFSLENNINNKGERYRRRLFDETIVDVNNKRSEVPKNLLCNNEDFRHSAPDNMIFFSEVVSKEPVYKEKKQQSKYDHLFSDEDIMKYFVTICKHFGQNDFTNIFRDKYPDPEMKVKESLKLSFKLVLKDYIRRQKRRESAKSTPSSSSEILLEPDSDIARRVKKNVAFQQQKKSSASNSTDSTQDFVNKVNARTHYPSTLNTIDDNIAKRKRVPSSKGSQPEVPSSTQAIADPKSVRADSKMNKIHPYRQEIVARYLEDQKSFSSGESEEMQEHQVRKEKLYIAHDSEGIFLSQKSTKYIPAILRKNRNSLAECIAKEKATLLNIEMYPSDRNHDSSALEINLDNIESEHTPETMVEPLIEAPKCKYVHLNAKYNQPPRINIPMVQINRHQRNTVTERHSQRCQSPSSIQNNFALSQNYLSPIKQLPSYTGGSNHEFFLCQLSQESSHSDNANGMTRMVSFGDIQDRTNRLTLCSQNQKCSQETSEHAYASQRSHPNCHCQACEATSNCNLYANQQPHTSYAEPSYDRSNCECSNTLRCMERASYVPQNEYQVIPHSEHSSNNYSCCQSSSSMDPMVNCVPVRQPIKYHATEGNRRKPIYNPNESCSFVRKQPYQSTTHSGSSDFEYIEMLKMNNGGGGGGGGGGDRPQSFAPVNGNQRYIVQRQIAASPAVCQQVTYRHGHRPVNANEAHIMNNAFLYQHNRQLHSKRQ